MNPAFEGRVALVTGAGSGIGREICIQLAARGARVVATDLDAESAQRTASAIWVAGRTAEAARLDVRDPRAWESVVGESAARHGRLDYLFNNAGVAVAGEARHLSPEHWERVLAVNLHGVLHGISAVYPRLLSQGSGHVVNVASLAGLVPAPGMAPYAASKHAVVGLTSTLRAEAEDLGVRFTAFCPSFLETGIYEAAETAGGVGVREVVRRLRLPIRPVAPAVAALLRGVERNRAVVVWPAYARAMWAFHRLSPALYAGTLGAHAVRPFRVRGDR